MDSDKPPVIIDLGSAYIKAGFAGEDAPRVVFPNIVGRPKNKGIMVGSETKDYYVGTQAEEKRGILTLSYPIGHGIVEDWDDLEKVIEHCFTNELRVRCDEHPVLITEAPLNPKVNREKLTSILFDTFRVPGLYVANSAAVSLHSTGKLTGVVVDSGDGVTHVVPFFDGYALQHAILRSSLAGRDVTDYLVKLMSEHGYQMTTSAEREIVKNIKETLGYVALDIEEEKRAVSSGASKEAAYEMPDGQVLQVGGERFRATEILFNPALIGRDALGLAQLVHSAIMKCDVELQPELFQNIALAGGSTLFNGLAERLSKEVAHLAPPALAGKVKVIAIPERKYAAWIGGSILSSQADFAPRWITREEYDEHGPNIVHFKCF